MAFPRLRILVLIVLASLLGVASLWATGGTIRFPQGKCRALDTRDPTGPTGGAKMTAGVEYVFDLTTAACPLNPDGVDAFMANLTIAAPSGPGFVHLRRNGDPLPIPLTSDINYDFNWTIANAIDVPVDAMGRAIFLAGVSDVHLIVDVFGFHADPIPVGFRMELNGFYVGDALMEVSNDGTGISAAGIKGNSFNSAGVIGWSANYFGGVFSSNTMSSLVGDSRGGGTYGVVGLVEDGSNRSGVLGDVVDKAGAPLARGFLGLNLSGTTNWGVYAQGNYGGTGAKYFVEPHPQRADMVIRYIALEGPEAGTYFRGRGKFQNGLATIEVPEDFRLVTDPDSLTVQVTPIGEMASVAVVRMGLDRIVVRGSRSVQFSYLVHGVRKSHRDLTPIVPGIDFMPEHAEATMPAYLTPVQKEFLISNGTYNADGTVNAETARSLGWDKKWRREVFPAAPKREEASPE